MGYSSRYHVASLAAVFLALGIGILIGAGLNGVVSDTTKSLEASLRGEIENSHGKIDDLNRELAQQQSYEESSYPGLVRGMLAGRRIAVIALGDSDAATRGDILQVVGPSAETGAMVQNYDVVTEPPDLQELAADLRDKQLGRFEVSGLARGGDALATVARHAGRALVEGGPLFKAIKGTLLKTESGAPSGVDAVIVTRQQPDDLDPAETDATAQLEAGILDGLASTKLPVVGVETSTADPSSISLFAGHGVSSVDDVDMYAGRVALAYALAGSKGAFGIKPAADRLLPALRSPRRGPAPGDRQATSKPNNKP